MSEEQKPSEKFSLLDELRRRNVFRVAAAYLVSSWLIIQVAETILPAFDFGDDTIRTIVIVLSAGFIPFLIFSWVFEITPEGLKREVEVSESESISLHTGRKIDRLIIILLTIGIAYFAVDKFLLESNSSNIHIPREPSEESKASILDYDKDKSVVVLPFTDMSPNKDQGYLADGISSDILNLLAKLPELRVISRTSAFSFKGQQIGLGEIAKRLRVNHVLEGTVRLYGKKLRITAQLVNATTDTQLWSEIYDREVGNIFEIQDEITAAVVGELAEQLSPPKTEKVDLAVYNDFLKAEHMREQFSEESLMNAKHIYEDIVSRAPDYAPAWLGLGKIYAALDSFHLIEPEAARQSAIESAEKALAADPSMGEAYTLRAWTRIKMGYSFAEVAQDFQRATELEPTNPNQLGNTGLFLSYIGRLDGSIALTERQVSLDPASVVAYNNLGIRYRLARKYGPAEAALKTALELNPNAAGIMYERGVIELLNGDPKAAKKMFLQEPILPFKLIGLALLDASNGNANAAQARVKELIDSYGDSLAYYYAMISAMSRDADAAFIWLDKAITVGDTDLPNAIHEPLLDNVRGDPRWRQFLLENGQSPEQLAQIQFTYRL